jgi:hypothetical protein
MFNQTVNLVESLSLYNILTEIKSLFKFNIYHYKSSNDLITDIKSNNFEHSKSIIIVNNKNHKLFSYKEVDKNTLLVFEELPLKIEMFIDIVNSKLIKQKYNYQSKLNIKNYILNLNSRIISKDKVELKLTEKEIDIILFLKDNQRPQSVDALESDVWGFSSNLETHTVETHIYRLRKKIKDKFGDMNFIISHDKGYLI